MTLGFSIPLIHGRRGGGLGNEVFPWAKAFIASQELGLRLVHPAWGLNARGYRRDFGASRGDWLIQRGLRTALPTVRLTEQMVRSTGEVDYALAIRSLAAECHLFRRTPYVVTHEGMSGGYSGIHRARDFLVSELRRPGHVRADLYRISRHLDPERLTVALHIREGDFSVGDSGPAPGEFNRALPSHWYENVVAACDDHFEGRAQYVVISDNPASDLIKRLAEKPSVVLPPDRHRPMLSDLLTMVGADVLVCSVSSFSMLAAFLSGKPYIWFEPHLNDHEGWRSLWGHEEFQQTSNGLTKKNIDAVRNSLDPGLGRGFPVGMNGVIPSVLLEMLDTEARLKRHQHDLLYYGITRG